MREMDEMSRDGSVTALIHLLRSEDTTQRDLAAGLIWRRYFQDLLAMARKNLNRRIRPREDEEDVLQEMYQSFCSRQTRGEFDLAGRDDLWKMLVAITLRKARNMANKQACKKRDVARERGIPDLDESGVARRTLEQMEAAGPTPAEAALFTESLELRLGMLADSNLRQVALLRLDGFANHEIAMLLNCSKRSVERRVERIREKWLSCDESAP